MRTANGASSEFACSRITASSSRPVRGSRAKSPAPLRASGSPRINSEISANSDDMRPEVSRAEGKLAGAARAFAYDFRGKVVLDIGSSTGGFTEYALRHGAKKVIAVEKGTGQMKAPLRFDSRVELHEKTDIMDVCFGARPVFFDTGLEEKGPHTLERQQNRPTGEPVGLVKNIGPFSSNLAKMSKNTGAGASDKSAQPNSSSNLVKMPKNTLPDVILADVSFTSLKPILEHARKCLADEHTDFLVMLKPQFEARPEQLWKGVVKNERMRRDIIKNFEQWLKKSGFVIVNKRDNEVVGKNGNQERFYWLKN